MVQRVEEVWKVAKVGSKRTPSHPVFVLKFREVKKDPKRRFYPQTKKQWPKHEARKKLISPRVLAIRKSSNSGEKVKTPV